MNSEQAELIIEQLKQLNLSFKSIDDRVKTLENANDSTVSEDPPVREHTTVTDHEHTTTTTITDRRSNVTSAGIGPNANDTQRRIAADIQRDYERLRDSLNRTPVPEGLKVYDNSIGIKKEDKHALKILSKCARYTETALKIVSSITAEDIPNSDCIFTCLAAEINFLQSEYTSLVVKSTFDTETERIFRQFENNSTTFSDISLQNVRVAAELAAVSNRGQSSTNRRVYERGSFPRSRGTYYRHQRGSRSGEWRGDFAGRTFGNRPPPHRPIDGDAA